jgi:hypothetical protein
LIGLNSFPFRTVFGQFEYVSKHNGHLGLMIPVSQQIYPQFLWTSGAPRKSRGAGTRGGP